MNHQDVVVQLVELLTELVKADADVKVDVTTIDENTGITSELGFDSLKVMDLVVMVEDHFDISVPINALSEVRTVGDFAALIQKSTGESA